MPRRGRDRAGRTGRLQLGDTRQVTSALRGSVAKSNINTELAPGFLADVVSVLPPVLATHDSIALWRAGRGAVTTTAVRSIHTLACSHQGVATISRSAVPPDKQPLKEERTQYV